MKKFLFTLAAMFMVTSAFAASYMYIDANAFTVTEADIENGTEIEVPVRAHFFARVSGWDFEITNLPAGMTFTFAEKGASFDVTTKNARGRDQVVSATLYGAEAPYLHMLAVQGEVGYWQDPNGENPDAWVSYGVTKWEGGDYEEMLLMYAVFDSSYHGGKFESITAVSSGKDSRGDTVTDYPGEQSTFWPVPEDIDTNFPDPNPITDEPVDVAAPTHDITMDAENVYVTINWPETDGAHVYTGQEVYPRPAYGEEAESYDVEAYTEAAPGYNESAHDQFTVNVPAQDPVWQDVAAPAINTEVGEDVVTVNIVWPETTGEHIYNGEYTYTRPEIGEADITVEVEAYTTESYPYRESVHAVETITIPAKQEPAETVTYVKVTSNDQLQAGKHYVLVAGDYAMGEVVANSTAPGVAITLNGDEVEIDPTVVTVLTLGESLTQYGSTYWPVQLPNGQYLACGGQNKFKMVADASSTWNMWKISATFTMSDGDYGYPIKMGRTNNFGPTSSSSDMTYAVLYVEKTTEVEKIPVAAPTHDITMDAENVYVTITWPETDGEHVYTGLEVYPRPAYGEEAESYDVEAYTLATETYEESAHDAFTVNVPAQDPVWQDVAAPTHDITMDAENVYVTITWPETTGNHVYTGLEVYPRPAYGEEAESYDVEAYTEADYPYNESAHDAFTVNVPAQDPVWQDVAAPTHDITMDAENVYVTITWPETTGNHVYTGLEVYPRPAYGEEAESYDVEAYTEANYPYNESAHDAFTVNVPAQDPVWQEVAAPTHDITMDADNVYVTINWPETTGNHVYTGLEVYPRPAYGEEAESYDVEAYTEADYPYSESAHDAFTVNVPAKDLVPVLSSEPIITFVETTEDGKVVAVEVVVENYDSYQIYVNDELLRGTVINASTEEAKVIRVVATNDDDDEAPAYLPNTIERTYTLNKLEQEELEKTDAPSIAANAHMGNIYDEEGNLVEEHHGYYQVVVTETEAGSDLEYRVKFNDGEWSDWMPYTPDLNFDVEGNYVVEARAKVEGKDYSDPVTVSFSVTKTTGLELLNGEKAVAGVRYFNVAGQEMQEANGITIVVTTYTDGSVTAVKVMK